jgi:hypothetical protein
MAPMYGLMFRYSILVKHSQELEELEKRNGVRKNLGAEQISKAIADVNRKITASLQGFMVSNFLSRVQRGRLILFFQG